MYSLTKTIGDMADPILPEIAQKIRSLRQSQGLTLHNVAEQAGVSKSLLSKVENGRAVPSLPVLISIIRALSVDMDAFFEGIGTVSGDALPYVHKPEATYQPFEREAAVGFFYQHILDQNVNDILLEAVVLELHPGSQRAPLVTDGHEFKYVLEGTVDYQIGEHTVRLHSGDSLFFDGRIPHVPVNNSHEVVKMLVVYLLDTKDDSSGL